ncbi:MAG: DUF896 domain-containing protein [Clostridia bacterium]|nr:DUF896 domain-containing protein [Clostridia bacterium]
MDKKMIERINALAKKSREQGLTEDEKKEQAQLRAQYIAAFRAGTEQTLKNVYIVDKDGNEQPLKKAKKQSPFS